MSSDYFFDTWTWPASTGVQSVWDEFKPCGKRDVLSESLVRLRHNPASPEFSLTEQDNEENCSRFVKKSRCFTCQ